MPLSEVASEQEDGSCFKAPSGTPIYGQEAELWFPWETQSWGKRQFLTEIEGISILCIFYLGIETGGKTSNKRAAPFFLFLFGFLGFDSFLWLLSSLIHVEKGLQWLPDFPQAIPCCWSVLSSELVTPRTFLFSSALFRLRGRRQRRGSIIYLLSTLDLGH